LSLGQETRNRKITNDKFQITNECQMTKCQITQTRHYLT